VDGAIAAVDQRGQGAVVLCGVDTIDALLVQAADAWGEAASEHGKGGEVDLGVAVGVSVMLLQGQVALVVEQAIQDIGSIAVGAFDDSAVERGIVVGYK
jgi:hypothetical protein